MFINRMMHGGKRSTARGVMYNALELVEERAKRDPMEVFEQALRNVAPGGRSQARCVSAARPTRCRSKCRMTRGVSRWRCAGCCSARVAAAAICPRSWLAN